MRMLLQNLCRSRKLQYSAFAYDLP